MPPRAFVLVPLTLLVWFFALRLHSASLAKLNEVKTRPHRTSDPSPAIRQSDAISDGPDKVLTFVQISDLHISKFQKVGGLAHFTEFLESELPLIAPELVVATGDLTDAKDRKKLTSQQYLDEWFAYHSVLQTSGVLERKAGKFWWDQRGNHDCFNLPAFEAAKNPFSHMSAVKAEGYAHHLHKSFGTYSFIALDACPHYGVSRPFNFFGYVETSDMDFLASELAKSASHNHTFVMSHYPTATMMFGKTSDGRTFWELSKDISVWLCGHLHRLFAGLGKTMYAYQGTFLELEVADLKVHAVYRIVAIDHDVVSFIDLPLGASNLPMHVEHDIEANPHVAVSPKPRISNRQPIVMITNPKDGRYAIPLHEPANSVQRSEYIRVLVWTAHTIKSVVHVTVDGRTHEIEAEYRGKGRPWRELGVEGARKEVGEEEYVPLWVIKWHPSRYDDGENHEMTVMVFDEDGRNGTSQVVRFRVDGERILDMQSGVGGAIIAVPFGVLFKDLFIVLYFLVTFGFLLFPKLFVARLKETNRYAHWRAEMATSLVVADVASRTSTPAKVVLTKLGLRKRRFSDLVPHRPWY
ncbi:Transmembrane protein 62, partial [Rhizophlyctis rosea]